MSSPGGVMSGPSVVFWLVVPFVDPRRWLGTLFALAGVVVSIVAALLPSSVMQRISRPPPSAPPHRHPSRTPPSRRIFQKRPYVSPIQPAITSVSCRPFQRPHTAGEISLAPHVTFTRGPPPRSSSTGSILASSASNSPSSSNSIVVHIPPVETSTLLSQLPDKFDPFPITFLPALTPFPPVPARAPPALASPRIPFPSTSIFLESDSASASISQFNSTVSLQSVDCLDLDAPTEVSSSQAHRELSPSPKRSFHLPLPKMGLAKRRSTPNIKTDYESTGQKHGMKRSQTSSGEKQNPSVTRSTTLSNPSLPKRGPSPLPPSSRRKFSIFFREGHVKKDILPHPSSSTPDAIPPVPPLPTHFAPARARSFNATATAVPSSTTTTSSFSSLVQTQTPPPRPARTDPYKTHGVPVPGSERARAFLRAEREVRERRRRSKGAVHSVKRNAGEGSEAVLDVPMVEAASEFGVVYPTPVPEQTRRRNCDRSRYGFECTRMQQDPEPQQPEQRLKEASDFCESLGAVRKSKKALGSKERGYVSDTVCGR